MQDLKRLRWLRMFAKLRGPGLSTFGRAQLLRIYTDGAIRSRTGGQAAATGLAAIVRDEDGMICGWWSWQAGPMSCNEAEYAAAILALERMGSVLRVSKPFGPSTGSLPGIELYSDSQIMIEQMQGLAQVRSPRLKTVHARLRVLASGFGRVSFHYLPREQNRLADALANEALDGKIVG